MQCPQVIVPGKPHLRNLLVLKQFDEALGNVDTVEPEEEAYIAVAYLQQCHFVQPTTRKRRARLRIESEDWLLHEELHRSVCILLTDNDFYAPGEEHAGQACKERLIVFVKYLLQL